MTLGQLIVIKPSDVPTVLLKLNVPRTSKGYPGVVVPIPKFPDIEFIVPPTKRFPPIPAPPVTCNAPVAVLVLDVLEVVLNTLLVVIEPEPEIPPVLVCNPEFVKVVSVVACKEVDPVTVSPVFADKSPAVKRRPPNETSDPTYKRELNDASPFTKIRLFKEASELTKSRLLIETSPLNAAEAPLNALTADVTNAVVATRLVLSPVVCVVAYTLPFSETSPFTNKSPPKETSPPTYNR